MTVALGVDVGGTGIKAALVDTATGSLVSERFRRDTPQPATPEVVRDAVVHLQKEHGLADVACVGIALPGVVRDDALWSATNLDPSWIGRPLTPLFDGVADTRTVFLNDADAAGIAEAAYGAARGVPGLAVMVTLGTGIGVALIHDGRLVPNCEMGRLQVDGRVGESFASARARELLGLSWSEWARGVSRYLQELETMLTPELLVIGGGITKDPQLWFDQVECATPMRLAALSKSAGIVGAAMVAADV